MFAINTLTLFETHGGVNIMYKNILPGPDDVISHFKHLISSSAIVSDHASKEPRGVSEVVSAPPGTLIE